MSHIFSSLYFHVQFSLQRLHFDLPLVSHAHLPHPIQLVCECSDGGCSLGQFSLKRHQLSILILETLYGVCVCGRGTFGGHIKVR